MFRRFLGWTVPALGWLLTGANIAVNWIGRSTVVDDTQHAAGLMEKAFDWFFALPSWAVGLCAMLLTAGYWYWLFRPSAKIAAEAGMSVDDIKHNYKVIPVTGDLAELGLSSPGVDVHIKKHDAPNQDGIERNWKRVCFGFNVKNVSGQNITLRMRALAFDPEGWRFYDEIELDTTLAPEEWRDFYPVELHMRKSNTPRIRYKRDGEMAELDDEEKIAIVVETYSDDVELDPLVYQIRLPLGHERFVVDEGVEVPEIDFKELH